MPRKSKSTIMVPVRGKQVTIPKASATKVVIVSSTSNNKKSKSLAKRRRSKNRERVTGMSKPLAVYTECLSDPFNKPPIRLGFDTFLPTSLHTAYVRTNINANGTDGSFDIVAFPNLSNALCVSAAGYSAAPTWASIAAANVTILANSINEARVIGMALRVFPQQALTAAPGIISSGVTPRCDINDTILFMGQTTGARLNLPYNEFFLGRTGNTECQQVVWRPTDISDFIFHEVSLSPFNIASGNFGAQSPSNDLGAGTYDSGGAFIHISGNSLPPSTPIFIELVIHFECTNAINNIVSDSADDSTSAVCNDTSVPDAQSAYRRILDYLPNPSQALTALEMMGRSQLGKAAMRYARGRLDRAQNEENGFVRIT